MPGSPCGPCCPVSPLGIIKSKIAALDVPLLDTTALVPGAPVLVEPVFTVAASPSAPASPGTPWMPCGIIKLKSAALVVPEFVTDAFVPAAPVDVDKTSTVAASPGAPSVPSVPAAPVCPCAPGGIAKSNTAALVVPLFVTVAA